MFRSKKDVDRHVKDIFIKLKSSEEKNLRCYNIAKLYYQVGDYESAKKYVSNYLEIRDKSAGAHKLLGQALEALAQKEAALMQYKISLELDPRQDDLLLKVCELLSEMDVSIDVNKIKYWVERADKIFPHHPIVFELKEKMLTLEKPSGNDDDLEKLITSELSVRQTDIHLQVKLIKHYISNHRLEDAYNYAAGIEATHSHRNNIIWYQSLSELLVKCKESKESDWTFWIFYISVLERYTALCIKEQGIIMRKSIMDVIQAVFNFDQSLYEFKYGTENFSNHPAFIEHMLLHMWGQLHFHLACLVLRKTKLGEDSWSEAGRLCSPLLLAALHVTPIDPTAVWTMHLNDRLKNQIHVWYREGSYRCSQAGHVLQDYARDNTKKLLDKINKFWGSNNTNSWRERVYQRIFVCRLYQDGKTKSYFVNSTVSNPPLRLCSSNELKRFDEISEEVWPDSLHHQVWLGLRARSHRAQNEPYPNQTSRVFCELQFSVYNLHQAAPDSLSRLDVDAFLNAAVFCATSAIEEQQIGGLLNPEKLPTFPADLTNSLCTCAQEQWWSYAYKVYSMDKQKPLDEDLGELRLELQRGLEVVRCIGNHGLHPVLLVHLARIFHYRAETLKETDSENSDISDLEARSEMYWSAAVPLLERLQNNQTIRITNSKYFNYQGKEMDNAELIKALEEGKLLLAQRFVRDKQYEKAIDALQALKCPEASFQQGQMYEKLGDEIISSIPKESLTSEMRSQHIIMLSKARECFYLTLDRLRSPGTNPKHPLNSELSSHISDIENKLKRIDPDLSRGDLSRNECDGMSDESYSSAHSGGGDQVTNTVIGPMAGLSISANVLSTPQKNVHRAPKQSSTPYRPYHQDLLDVSRNRSEARPSPERLDAQIRSLNQLMHSKDSMMQSISEQNKTILEQNKTLMDKVEKLTKEMAELRKDVQKQRTQPVTVVPSLEEDLFTLNEEDYNDFNYGSNQSGATSLPGSIFQSSNRHTYPQLLYPSAATFQGYHYPGMSFSDPNAPIQTIPPLYNPNVYSTMPVLYPNANTRSKMPENILQQSMFAPPTNQPLQIPLQKIETSKPDIVIKDAPVNKGLPVNVSITTSDVLPTTTPVIQPTLSVTIPPQFRQGTSATSTVSTEQSAPHCYQISMPSQAMIPTTVNLPSLSHTITTTPAAITAPGTLNQDTTVCSTGSANSSDHEHDPIPDFVPVIPLPAEVKVTTGEEGEETLFCARAKLFRFVDNEWKERGIGNVKLLKNQEGKVRLVMRREQVFKVCANHYLSPDMELSAKANNEKAWFWVANDFADGELQLEKFCIRFKTVEEGLSFKEHFDKAKANLPQASPEKTTDKKSTKVPAASSDVKKIEKTKTEAKSVEQTVQKQSTDVTIPISKIVTSDKSKTSANTTVVGGFSFSTKPIIQKVTTAEPVKAPPKTEMSPFAGFTFSKTVTSADSFPSTTLKSTGTTASSQFTFPFAKTSAALQSGSTTVQTVEAPISSSQTAKQAVQQVSKPQASLLEMFKPPADSWECNNCYIRNTGTKCMACETPRHSTSSTTASAPVSVSVPAKQTVQQASKPQASLSELFKPPADSWECNICYIRNTGTKCVACETPRHPTSSTTASAPVSVSVPASAPSQQVPLSQMFKPPAGSWECDDCYSRNGASDMQCVACEKPRRSASNKSSTVSSNQLAPQIFKAATGTWKCKACDIVNASESNYCVTCDTPKDPSLPPKPKTDGFQISGSSSGATPTFTFGMPQDPAKKGTTGGFSFRLNTPNDASGDSKSVPEFSAKTDMSAATFVFGMPQNTTMNKGSTFVFGTPGKSFGFNLTTKTSPVKTGEEEHSEEEVEESEDIYFPPVIPLPDKIEIKTGEEDEEVLYSHRAKLFRFDKPTEKEEGQWKERGLGDIKLLRHKETGKLRLVMRREQVLKLCLNHFVFADLELKPKDEKTLMWNAADYSEGEIEHTLFACRFKTSEIANEFKDIIEKSIKNIGSEKTTEVKTVAQDVEILYEMKVTPEEKQAALKLQLPENFYAYKQKADCPGCRGCDESGPSLFQNGSPEKAVSESQKLASEVQFPKIPGLTVRKEVTPELDPTLYKICSPQRASFESNEKLGSQYGTNKSQAADDFASKYQQWRVGETVITEEHDDDTNEQSRPQILTSILKKDSPITSRSASSIKDAATFSFASPLSTPTTSVFGQVVSGKNMFGGTSSKKDAASLLKPSSFSINTNNSESIFSNSFNTPPKTTVSLFGSTTTGGGLFGSPTLETGSEVNPISFISTQTTTTTTTSVFDTSATSTGTIFSNTSSPFSFNSVFNANKNLPSFTTSTTAVTYFETPAPTTSETPALTPFDAPQEDDISFLPAKDISFSTLAKASESTFKIDPNYSFAGAGTAVFGSKSNSSANKSIPITTTDKKHEDEKEECDENENQEHDPHFEPIIPLPDIVEVHTGEEDEEKVFCHRAKLYRYDTETHEWKERGVGDMKILHHATRNTYRLLLRREQVHKVVCNMLLTPEISFNQLASSDCAWIWAGVNHAEGQCLEKLAVRFKTSELAASFKGAIDNILQTLSESREKNVQHDPVIEEPEDDENEEADEREEVIGVGVYEEEEEEEEEEEDDEDDDKKSAALDDYYVY